MRILIVGLGTAGLYAAKWARAVDPRAEIVIVEKRSYPTFSPCGIPLAIEGATSFDSLRHPFPVVGNTKLLLEHEAIALDLEARRAEVRGPDGSEVGIRFDRLIYAPGAEPFVPPVPGARGALGRDVFTIKVVEDGERIVRRIEEKGAKSAVVVGAGPIGCEVAHALRRRGLEVTVVEMLPSVFPKSLDPDMGAIVERFLSEEGVGVLTSCPLEEVILEDGEMRGVSACGNRIDADIAIMATGVRPDVSLLKDQVEIDRGIVVDEKMMTSVEGVFAAGDVAVVRHKVTGEQTMVQLASAAMRQGIVAGVNAAGGDMVYRGSLGTFSSAMGEFEVAATGIRSKRFYKVSAFPKPEWAGGERVTLKLFVEGDRIVGAQAVGPRATHEIDVIASLVDQGGTVEDALMLERAYCPAITELNMPLTSASEIALRRIVRRR